MLYIYYFTHCREVLYHKARLSHVNDNICIDILKYFDEKSFSILINYGILKQIF